MARTRVIVAGVRNEDELFAAADEGVDAVGFELTPGMPRAMDPEAAAELMALLPPLVSAVGVYRDPDPDAFAEAEQVCPAPYTELGGEESERLVRACGPDVIKRVEYDASTITAEVERWGGLDEVAAILIDRGEGGRGAAEDWAVLGPVVEQSPKPVVLAGALLPDNVAAAIRSCRPWAVRVSATLVDDAGSLSTRLVAAFCRAVRRADAG